MAMDPKITDNQSATDFEAMRSAVLAAEGSA